MVISHNPKLFVNSDKRLGLCRQVDLELGFGGNLICFDCLFHVASFLTPLFAIGNITI